MMHDVVGRVEVDGWKWKRNLWESEAPAELGKPRFGRSLTLPINKLLR
jgi:hypothetical protein